MQLVGLAACLLSKLLFVLKKGGESVPITGQQGSCCPNNFVGFCLVDGTPIALVLEGTVQLGWINLLTGIFTGGPPPPGTIVCGGEEITSPSTIVTRINSSTSTVVLAPNNTLRKAMVLWNDSNSVARIKFGAGASTFDFTWKIGPQSGYELPEPVYVGIVTAVWEAANGAMQVTEEV